MACIPVVWEFILHKQYSVYIVIRMCSHNCLYTTYSKVRAYIMWLCLPLRYMGRSSCSLAFGVCGNWENMEYFQLSCSFRWQRVSHTPAGCRLLCLCLFVWIYISNNIYFFRNINVLFYVKTLWDNNFNNNDKSLCPLVIWCWFSQNTSQVSVCCYTYPLILSAPSVTCCIMWHLLL